MAMMRRFLVSMTVAFILLLQAAIPISACGDKLLVLGRGIRFQSRHTPRAASVLLYLPATPAGQFLSDPNIESALREAGHTVHAVTTQAELEAALRSGGYDVVLANITNAQDLGQAQTIASGSAVVLPAVYLVGPADQRRSKQQVKADEAKAAKDFGVVIAVPSRPGYYCAAVDKAMALKLKREKSAGPSRS
jgi:hypothetical protein